MQIKIIFSFLGNFNSVKRKSKTTEIGSFHLGEKDRTLFFNITGERQYQATSSSFRSDESSSGSFHPAFLSPIDDIGGTMPEVSEGGRMSNDEDRRRNSENDSPVEPEDEALKYMVSIPEIENDVSTVTLDL